MCIKAAKGRTCLYGHRVAARTSVGLGRSGAGPGLHAVKKAPSPRSICNQAEASTSFSEKDDENHETSFSQYESSSVLRKKSLNWWQSFWMLVINPAASQKLQKQMAESRWARRRWRQQFRTNVNSAIRVCSRLGTHYKYFELREQRRHWIWARRWYPEIRASWGIVDVLGGAMMWCAYAFVVPERKVFVLPPLIYSLYKPDTWRERLGMPSWWMAVSWIAFKFTAGDYKWV